MNVLTGKIEKAAGSATGAKALAQKVESARLMTHIEEFGRHQKPAGSAGEAKSLRYIRKELDRAGLDTRLIEHPAYISLPGPASLRAGGRDYTVITHSMAQSSPAGGLTGRLVDLGAGAPADYDAVDVAGAIVILDGMATPGATLRASRAGAAAQIHVSPHDHLHEMCLSPLWGSPSADHRDWLPTTVVVTVSDTDGAALRAAVAAGEVTEATIEATVDTGWRQTPILEADLLADEADENAPWILFSGHHDAWYEGVMDNGGANATMLEVARLVAESAGRRRNLRFCFWSGHSQGRYSGSAWYADTRWEWLERHCAVHVNVDSTGGRGNEDLTKAPVAAELAAFARDAVEAETGTKLAGIRLARNSDQSFWGIGVPSIFSLFSQQPKGIEGVRNALGWWWHTPHDLADKIDPQALVRDTRAYVHTLFRLVCDPVLPLDHAAQLDGLRRELDAIELTDTGDVPIAALRQGLAELSRSLGDLSPRPGGEPAHDRVLMRLSRRLVPVDYTAGDRFSHDPSLPQAPWPCLDPLRRLAATRPGSDDFHFAHGPAVRAVNRVVSALGEARRELTQYLQSGERA